MVKDVVVIGGGVVGCAVARWLTRYRVDVALIEREVEVGFGTSKANSGIIHAGHHAAADTLKGNLVVKGNALFDELHQEVIPDKRGRLKERIPVTLPEGVETPEELLVRVDAELAAGGGPYAYFQRERQKKLVVKIPPGVRSGQKIRLSGLGQEGKGGGKNGDLFLLVKVKRPLLESRAVGGDRGSMVKFEASLVRVTRREYDRARKLPTALVADLAQATSLGHSLWQQARARSDFPRFEPQLEKIVDLTLQKAEALGYDENPYDALLDEFEPGMKTAQVAALFEEMRAGLVPLVEAISDRVAAVDGHIDQIGHRLCLHRRRRAGDPGRLDLSGALMRLATATLSATVLATALLTSSAAQAGGIGIVGTGIQVLADEV